LIIDVRLPHTFNAETGGAGVPLPWSASAIVPRLSLAGVLRPSLYQVTADRAPPLVGKSNHDGTGLSLRALGAVQASIGETAQRYRRLTRAAVAVLKTP